MCPGLIVLLSSGLADWEILCFSILSSILLPLAFSPLALRNGLRGFLAPGFWEQVVAWESVLLRFLSRNDPWQVWWGEEYLAPASCYKPVDTICLDPGVKEHAHALRQPPIQPKEPCRHRLRCWPVPLVDAHCFQSWSPWWPWAVRV